MVLTCSIRRNSDKNDAEAQSNQPWKVWLTVAPTDGHPNKSIASHSPVTSTHHVNIVQTFKSPREALQLLVGSTPVCKEIPDRVPPRENCHSEERDWDVQNVPKRAKALDQLHGVDVKPEHCGNE